jgi:L-amino acid N-acyltransferase YncA
LGYFKESLQVDECIDDQGKFRDTVQFVKLLNPKMEGRITESLPHGYSIEEVGPDYFGEAVDKKMDFVFSEDLIFRARSIYSEFENQKLATLGEGFVIPYRYFAVVRFDNEVVGWTWGYQDSKDSFYMVNSGLLAEHRGKGLYSRLLKNVMKVLMEKGFQRVWSRHNMTNNEILIPKLKFGFHITGTELSDAFGVLVHLTYFSNSIRKRVLNFRSGHESPNSEMRKVLGLEP